METSPIVENPIAAIELPSEEQQICKYCHSAVPLDDYFCPNCGKKLRNKPVSTGIGKQIVVYLISVFIPPFGLPWAFRYLRQPDEKSKIIGFVVIGLTIISIVINIWLIIAFIDQTNQALNSPSNIDQQIHSLYTQ